MITIESAINTPQQPIRVHGDLTFKTASQVLAKYPTLVTLLNESSKLALVDVSGVTKIDSAGLSVLLHWYRASAEQKTKLKFTGASEKMNSLIAISGLSDILT